MSLIHFHAEASSIEDLKRQLLEALTDGPTIPPHPLTLCGTDISGQTVADKVVDSPASEVSGSAEKGEPDGQDAPEQPKEEPVKTYSLADVRAQANALKDRFGIDALRDVFRLHGGEKLKDIPESSYAALMDDLRNLMKEDA